MATVNRELYKQVGRRIYNLRTKNNFTRAYLAAQVQISPKFLYEIENGRKGFTVQVLVRLAEVFGTTCDYLVSGQSVAGGDLEVAVCEALNYFNKDEQEKIAKVLKAVCEAKIKGINECAAGKDKK